ncbi:MAG: DHH family phosphoesterase [Coprobacillus sp.]|nr:DHH family phosphoesterase [Coprobacillus sp.]
MDSFYMRLLSYYSISSEEYDFLTREVTLNDIARYQIKAMSTGAAHILSHLDKKIMVYGDYDADGILSASIIVKALSMLGVEAGYYIPSRYIDGYGITLGRAKEIAEKHYDIVILVDNGLSAAEAVSYLKEQGLTVYIIDHHETSDPLPAADFIYTPNNGIGDVPISASELALIFSSYLLGKYDKYLLTLASISIISDMMPLRGFNRDLLRYTLNSYKDGEFLALDLLKEDEDFSYDSIAMKIAPKINAVGRIKKDNTINRLVKLFTSEDKWEIRELVRWLGKVNKERKEKSDSIDSLLDSHSSEEGVILLPILEGLSGIAANSALKRYKRPVIILCDSDERNIELKGSIRAPEGYDVIEILDSLKEYLVTYGGHTLAGGLTIARENIIPFSLAFNEKVSSYKVHKEEEKYLPIALTEILLENYYLISKLAPFGENWEAPLLKLDHVRVSSLEYSRDKRHILTPLSMEAKIIGFNAPVEKLKEVPFIDLYGEMRLNEYRGNISVEFLIKKYRVPYK